MMYTGGMAYWYGGNLSLLYSFQINRLRSVVLLLGMYFFYLYAIEGVHYILRQKNENEQPLQRKLENGEQRIRNIRFG